MSSKWQYKYFWLNIVEEKEIGNILNRGTKSTINLDLISELNVEDEKTTRDLINEYGSEGWELVSVCPIITDYFSTSRTNYLLFYFKRPINDFTRG